MSPRLRASRAAIDLLKRFEGFQPRAVRLPDGRWLIGHGHTRSAREGAAVTAADAEALLIYDLIATGAGIDEVVFAPLNQNQFDALCAFVFNIGTDSFRTSQVLRRLNEGSPLQAAAAMETWRMAEVAGESMVVDALVRRRAAERALFLTPSDGVWPVAPTAVLRPLPDPEAAPQIPRTRPAPVAAVFEDGRLLLVRETRETSDGGTAAAAAAVGYRLDALFPDEPPAAAPAEQEETLQRDAGGSLQEGQLPLPLPPAQGSEPALEDVEFEEPAPTQTAEAPSDELLAATAELPVYPFRRPLVARTGPQGPGLAVAGLLAVIGLGFFGGGVFWAFNAAPNPSGSPVTPQAVGWLAGVAGTLMVALAVFLALQRLGRRAEALRDL